MGDLLLCSVYCVVEYRFGSRVCTIDDRILGVVDESLHTAVFGAILSVLSRAASGGGETSVVEEQFIGDNDFDTLLLY